MLLKKERMAYINFRHPGFLGKIIFKMSYWLLHFEGATPNQPLKARVKALNSE